jgi:phosphatidate phosphatase APP1
MEEKKSRFSVPHMGASLLLVTFLILCLLMFATLSVTSARSNYLLAERSAQRQADYYSAVNAAQEVLAAVTADTSASVTDTSLGEVTIAQSTDDAGHTILSWEIPFTDTQALAVTVDIPDPAQAQSYTVTQWQTISTQTWVGTQTITVLSP